MIKIEDAWFCFRYSEKGISLSSLEISCYPKAGEDRYREKYIEYIESHVGLLPARINQE